MLMQPPARIEGDNIVDTVENDVFETAKRVLPGGTFLDGRVTATIGQPVQNAPEETRIGYDREQCLRDR